MQASAQAALPRAVFAMLGRVTQGCPTGAENTPFVPELGHASGGSGARTMPSSALIPGETDEPNNDQTVGPGSADPNCLHGSRN